MLRKWINLRELIFDLLIFLFSFPIIQTILKLLEKSLKPEIVYFIISILIFSTVPAYFRILFENPFLYKEYIHNKKYGTILRNISIILILFIFVGFVLLMFFLPFFIVKLSIAQYDTTFLLLSAGIVLIPISIYLMAKPQKIFLLLLTENLFIISIFFLIKNYYIVAIIIGIILLFIIFYKRFTISLFFVVNEFILFLMALFMLSRERFTTAAIFGIIFIVFLIAIKLLNTKHKQQTSNAKIPEWIKHIFFVLIIIFILVWEHILINFASLYPAKFPMEFNRQIDYYNFIFFSLILSGLIPLRLYELLLPPFRIINLVIGVIVFWIFIMQTVSMFF